MDINKSTLQNFRKDFQDAVKALEEKYGVVIQSKGITYETDQFHFKVEVKNGDSKEDIRQNDFNKYCRSFGLEESDYLRTFMAQGTQYQIIGINPSKRKNAIIIKNLSTGKEYICAPEYLPFIASKRLKRLGMHNCKYCGNTTHGEDEDALCPSCRQTFGHSFYSEL